MSSNSLVGHMSRSGLMGFVLNVVCMDLHPSMVYGASGGVSLFVFLGSLVLVWYVCRVVGPLVLPRKVSSVCHAGFHCTSNCGGSALDARGMMSLGRKPSCVQMSIFACVNISGAHWLTKYVGWLEICLWSEISRTSYGVVMCSL